MIPDYRTMLLDVEQLANMPPPEPLVEGLLDKGSSCVLYGPAGTHKTFLAAGLGLCIASGHRWQDRFTEVGTVVYCAAEGVAGFGQRVAAWQSFERIDKVPGFHFLPATVPLLAELHVAAFVEAVTPLEPSLVVVDTFARSMVGGDENSARDVGSAVRALDQVREATGATVLAVHHSGKDVERGMRGSSALLAGVDTVLAVKADGPRVRVVVERQKNHATAGTLHLEAVEHAGSLVLTKGTEQASGALAPSALSALAELARIEVPGGIPATAWMEATEQPRRTFYDARRRLLDQGFIRNVGTDQRPRYELTDEGTVEVQA